ncbi:MAG: 2-amino-4-hydroxy-6-hydroxymethyldihydropteridine diphosphokinase [Prevotella sp.]|nr:2-amino-4-hydroxy-6-hydroxymethyldihydropteridine diphosphokinase [Prevotella sp.]
MQCLFSMTDKHKVYLGLGSNLGNREDIIRKAISLIGERVGLLIRQSSLIETEPWGFESDNKFLNGVILCETTLTPRQVLRATQKIERELGKLRKHSTRRTPLSIYHDRPIDIDILLYDDLTIDEPDLKIPHPLMHERDFVMIPLKEIQ